MFEQKEPQSFERLYEASYHSVLKFVVLKCNNIDDVNDIIQDTYLELYKILTKNQYLKLDNYNAFIIGIAKNKIKKYYGIKYKMKNLFVFSKKDEIEIIDNIKTDINIEKIIINSESTKEIWLFLKSKDAIISKIVYLYYYLDLTIKEISEELNISESTVKNYLYRTLKQIRKKVGRESE